ncbi:MAG TPA: AbrB/MazE/SpoVT family DNA-binding domain-containing protein [Candidatus Bathyarchaeia archaeon]
MGVGETVNVDDRGRILIPAEIRRKISNRAFSVEMADKDTIILRAVKDRGGLADRVKSISLTGDADRANVDAAAVKDRYGGKRSEGN